MVNTVPVHFGVVVASVTVSAAHVCDVSPLVLGLQPARASAPDTTSAGVFIIFATTCCTARIWQGELYNAAAPASELGVSRTSRRADDRRHLSCFQAACAFKYWPRNGGDPL